MKHVFISHAGKDSGIAETLFKDLKDVGHDVCIDLKELTYGDDTIQFMNDAIADGTLFSLSTRSIRMPLCGSERKSTPLFGTKLLKAAAKSSS